MHPKSFRDPSKKKMLTLCDVRKGPKTSPRFRLPDWCLLCRVSVPFKTIGRSNGCGMLVGGCEQKAK